MTNPNDPAFAPVGSSNGMTKREAFAAIIASGLFGNPNWDARNIPEIAVGAADRLIHALNTKDPL